MATWRGSELTDYWVKLNQLFLIPLLRTLWYMTTLFIQIPANVQFSVLRRILQMLEMLQAVFTHNNRHHVLSFAVQSSLWLY